MTTTTTKATISPSIYHIADHLDAMLAHGEDLLALAPPAEDEAGGNENQQMHARLAAQRFYLEEVRGLESRIVSRVLRARDHAEQVRRVDTRFKTVTDLFVGGTHVVADAAADLADSTSLDFNTGRDSISYLRSRGLIDSEIITLPRCADLKITEAFRLAGSIELGALLDLAASYLDVLELHYELYGSDALAKEAARPDTSVTPPAP
jgi:hypothetical protein